MRDIVEASCVDNALIATTTTVTSTVHYFFAHLEYLCRAGAKGAAAMTTASMSPTFDAN